MEFHEWMEGILPVLLIDDILEIGHKFVLQESGNGFRGEQLERGKTKNGTTIFVFFLRKSME